MSEHTPGPWKAEQTAGGEWWITAPDSSDHDYRDDYEPIFEASGVGPSFEHDAKLAAAAPDLLEAVETAREFALRAYGYQSPQFRAMVRAIARARGN